MSTMTIRCDEQDKQMASEIAKNYGFDLSSVTRAFWKEIIRTNSIPLSLGRTEPNEESLSAIKETENMIKNNVKGKEYSSGLDFLDTIAG